MLDRSAAVVGIRGNFRSIWGARSIRFTVASAGGLAIDLGGFTLLTLLGVLPFVSNLASTALAITTVYFLATRFAFRATPTWRTYLAFLAWYSASALTVSAVIGLLSGGEPTLALIVKLCTIPVTFTSNYLYGRWLFGGGAERIRARLPVLGHGRDLDPIVLRRLLSRTSSTRRRFLSAGVFTLAFAVLIVPMNAAISFVTPTDRRGVLLEHLLQFGFLLCLFGSLCFVLRWAQAIRLGSVRHRRWLAVALAYLVVNLLLLAIIYPGFWVSDEYYTLVAAKQYSLVAWQGYITTLLYTGALLLGPSPIFIVLIQLGVIATIVGYVISELMQRLKRPSLAWLLIVPLLAPTVLLNNQYPLRLTLYGYLLLLLVVRLGIVAGRRGRRGPGRLDFIGLCGLIGVLSFWRSEGLPLLLLVPVCFVLSGMHRRRNGGGGRTILAAFAGVGLVAGLGGVTSATFPVSYQASAFLNPLSTMLQGDLRGENVQQDLRTLNETLDLKVVRKYPDWNETPSLFVGVFRTGSEVHAKSMFGAFFDLVINNPGPFLDNRLKAFAGSNSMQSDWVPQVTSMQVWQEDPGVFAAAEQFYSTNFLVRPPFPQVKYPVEQAMLFWYRDTGIPPFGRLMWNALPQLLMVLAVGLIAIVRRKWWWVLASGVVLENAAMVFLTEPASYFMYFFPAYLAGGTLVAGAAIFGLDKLLSRRRSTAALPAFRRGAMLNAQPRVLLATPVYNCAQQGDRVLNAVDSKS